ncbi:unnamed protein product [Rhizopus stolonifer]
MLAPYCSHLGHLYDNFIITFIYPRCQFIVFLSQKSVLCRSLPNLFPISLYLYTIQFSKEVLFLKNEHCSFSSLSIFYFFGVEYLTIKQLISRTSVIFSEPVVIL